MTNKKNKSKPNNNGNRAVVVRKQPQQSVNPKAVSSLCSITDPFCPHSRGAKSPYGSTPNTVTFSVRNTASATTGAAGDAFRYFRPNESIYNSIALATANSTFPTTAAMTGAMANFPTWVDEVRIVSAGIRWWCVLPDSATGGVTTVIPIDDDSKIINSAPITNSAFQTYPDSINLDIREAGAYICPPLVDMAEFRPTSTSTASFGDCQFGSVLLYFSGPATTKAIFFEEIINYEATLNFEVTNGSITGKLVEENNLLKSYYQKAARWAGLHIGNQPQVEKALRDKAKYFATEVLKTGARFAINKLLPIGGSQVSRYLLDSGAVDVD